MQYFDGGVVECFAGSKHRGLAQSNRVHHSYGHHQEGKTGTFSLEELTGKQGGKKSVGREWGEKDPRQRNIRKRATWRTRDNSVGIEIPFDVTASRDEPRQDTEEGEGASSAP